MVVGGAVIGPGVAGVPGFTTIVMLFKLVTVAGDAQTAFDVICSDITSPFISVEDVKVELFVPAGFPFNNHRYVGVTPPLLGDAVKVTDVLGQILFTDSAIVTEGVTTSFTVILISLLVTDAGEAHVALEVKTTVTLSLFTNDDDVKVGLLLPTFPPFSFH